MNTRGEHRAASRQRGITLLEVTIYGGLLVVLGGPFVSAMLFSVRSISEQDSFNKSAERGRSVVHRVSQELRTIISGSATVQNNGQRLVFTLPGGFNGAAIVPGPSIRYDLVPVVGESMNGRDDNGNRLIDEGQLVRQDLTNGGSFVLGAGFDLAASNFSLVGDAVRVTLVHFSALPDGAIHRNQKTVTISPRN